MQPLSVSAGLEVVAVVVPLYVCVCVCLCCRLVVPNVHPVARQRHRVCIQHTGCLCDDQLVRLPERLPAKLTHCSAKQKQTLPPSLNLTHPLPYPIPYATLCCLLEDISWQRIIIMPGIIRSDAHMTHSGFRTQDSGKKG